jgi:dynein heavy chain
MPLTTNLQKHPFLLGKSVQLHESQMTRHCNMVVDETMAGKSAVWKGLRQAKCALAKKEETKENFNKVEVFVINPKSVTLNELYGAYDLATMEGAGGVLSTVFRNCAVDEKPIEKWIMFDGPVDTLWIESMNSVMDDNKVLTLINGDRITMTQYMALVFEVENLSVASPATVSRAGMIYIDVEELGWEPYVESWLQRKFGKDEEAFSFCRRECFGKYVYKILEFKSQNCKENVPVSDFDAVQSLCMLYDCFDTVDNGLDRTGDAAAYFPLAEKWFVFSMIWSVMAAVDEKGRKLLDNYLRDIEAQFPPLGTVYEYFVDTKKEGLGAMGNEGPFLAPSKGPAFLQDDCAHCGHCS